MQPSSASREAGPSDIATRIAQMMRTMGILGLPRNYEILYNVLMGDKELGEEFAALGQRPKQVDLDKLATSFLAGSDRQSFVENAHDQVFRRTQEIVSLLGRERNSLEKFGMILDQTSSGLGGNREVPRDFMRKVVGIMAAATETTLEQAKQISTSMAEKSAELEKVKSKLEEYKKLADTDALTKLWNRRAFDKRLGRLYEDTRSIMFGALVLADIDGFKAFNDRYGHPAGDRILKIVGKILLANGGAGSFVARTGGEEFALVVEGLSEAAAMARAEAVRDAIAKAEFIVAPTATTLAAPITISLGLCMATEAEDPEDLYAKADRALYASKVNGRNRVTQHSKLKAGRFTKSWLLYRGD